MKINFFRLPKHRVFEYKPRHYDPDQEELMERVRKIEEGIAEDENAEKGEYHLDRSRINFRKSYAEQKRGETKLPMKKLLLYGMGLLVVAMLYYFIQNFAYLFNPANYAHTEQNDKNIKPDIQSDIDVNTQFIVVPDDYQETDENKNTENTQNTQ